MNITRLWHLRLGHMSIKSLKMLGKQGVLRSDKLGDLKFCEGCLLGKSTTNSSKNPIHKTMASYIIYTLIYGLAQEMSLGGNNYFLSIIDNFSRKVWIHVIKHKH